MVTDATVSNAREIDVYVALEQGLYLYDSDRARLAPVLLGDLRPLVAAPNLPRFGDTAPVRLVYVADVDRLEQPDAPNAAPVQDPEMQKSYYFVDCGIVAANVYLFAAAAGLNAWFHDCDRAGTRQAPAAASRSARAFRPDRRLSPAERRLAPCFRRGKSAKSGRSLGAEPS